MAFPAKFGRLSPRRGRSNFARNYCYRGLGKRWWSVRCEPGSFRAISGESELVDARRVKGSRPSGFCRHCGAQTYAWVDKTDWNPETYVAVSVPALDDLEPTELLAAPVQFCDGWANNWWVAPAETRHL